MMMMGCTARIKDGRLQIGLPYEAFIHAAEDIRERTDAKLYASDPNVIEVSDITVEFRVRKVVEL